MKKYILLFLFIFLLTFISANSRGISICIDREPPSEPSYLRFKINGNDILLEWEKATNKPSCSGIAYYNIARNGKLIANTTELSYLDKNMNSTTYNYSVWAVDKAGNNGNAIMNSVELTKTQTTQTTSFSGKSFTCIENWICSEWDECIEGVQKRNCNDINMCGTLNNRPITQKDCDTTKDSQQKTTDEESKETELINQEHDETQGFFSLMTGAVIGTGSAIADNFENTSFLIIIIFLLILIFLLIFIKLLKKLSKNKAT